MKWTVHYDFLMELYKVNEFPNKLKCDCVPSNKKFKPICVCKKKK